MSNWPWKFSNCHILVTIKGTAFWLITMGDGVIVFYLSSFWWPWEIRSRSNRPFTSGASNVWTYKIIIISQYWSITFLSVDQFHKLYLFNNKTHKTNSFFNLKNILSLFVLFQTTFCDLKATSILPRVDVILSISYFEPQP